MLVRIRNPAAPPRIRATTPTMTAVMVPPWCQGEDRAVPPNPGRRVREHAEPSTTLPGGVPSARWNDVGSRGSRGHDVVPFGVRRVAVRWPLGVVIGSSHDTADHPRRQGSVLERLHRKRPAGCPSRDVGRVATTREHPVEAPVRGVRGKPRQLPCLSRCELVRPFLIASDDRIQGGLPRVRSDPGPDEPARDDPPALLPGGEGVLHNGPVEGLVVDQTDLLQPVQFLSDLLRPEPRPLQPMLDLPPAPLAHGEEAEGPLVDVLALPGIPAACVRHVHSLAAADFSFASGPSSVTRSGTTWIGWSSSSEKPVRPTASRTFRSISSRRSMCSVRNARAFSRPWPSCSRSWLMKMAVVSNLEREPASLRMACDMRRAWRPTWVSPISPSISARGTSAATESITTRCIAPDRTSMSAISSACSPESG